MKPHIKIHPIKPSEGRAVTPLPAGAHGVTRPTGNVHAQYALHKDLRPDPGQPRTDFPEARQIELYDSVKRYGCFQEPLTVRADPEKKTKWMIVDGARRFLVATSLKLERLPIVVREFADEAAVRAYQRIVGTQRLNLSDLEQAASLDRELKLRQKSDPKFSITQLGEALGIPRATIYESFKLLKLSPPVVAALKAGTLDSSKARRFATVPVPEHPGLLKHVTKPDWHGEVMSVRDLDKLIEEEFSRQLSAAPWKLDDAELVKAAGPCTTCPKRSGNIEGMGVSPNVCTDVKCFESKQAAHTARVLTLAEKDGQRIVPAKEYGNHGHDFATADQKCHLDDKNRTYAQLAKHAGIEPAVTVDEKGAAVKVFTAEDKAKILKANKISVTNYAGSGRTAADKARAKKQKAMDAALAAAVPKILDKMVHGLSLDAKLWPLLAQAACDAHNINQHDFIAKRMGLSQRVNDSRDALDKWFQAPRAPLDWVRFTVELLLLSSPTDGSWHSTTWNRNLLAVAKLAGVNLEKLMKTPQKTPNHPTTQPPKPKGKKK